MAKAKLTTRERAVLALLPVSIVVMGGAFLLRGPLADYRASKDVLDAAEQRLKQALIIREQIMGDQQQVRDFTASLPLIDSRPLFTIVTETLNEVKLNQQEKATITSNAASTIGAAAGTLDTVQLSLKGVSLEELINVCHLLQSRCGLLIVEQMTNLGPAPDGQGLNVDLRISKVRVTGRPSIPSGGSA